jgi:hypothetical protein
MERLCTKWVAGYLCSFFANTGCCLFRRSVGLGSVLNEAILDTHTWAYVDKIISVGEEKPTGRHGHSVILDNKRNRLILFGGGTGTDLLRSGVDNAEVWELKLGVSWQENLEDSLPWVWNKLHSNVDATRHGEDDNDNDESDEDESSMEVNSNPLTAAERLCLGRCHNGLKITMDMALLVFGSGRPSTNGMIGYNLATDTFVRPTVSGLLPRPRFTGVSSFLEEDGYIFFHGGFCTQESETMSDMDILDLAPGLGRDFEGLPADTNRRSYVAIADDQVTTDADREFHSMLSMLTEAQPEARTSIAQQLLWRMNTGDTTFGNQAVVLMSMIASGTVRMQEGGDGNILFRAGGMMDDDDNNDDEEYSEQDDDEQDDDDQEDDEQDG